MARMTDEEWRKVAEDLEVDVEEAKRQVRRVLQALSGCAECDCAKLAADILKHVGNE